MPHEFGPDIGKCGLESSPSQLDRSCASADLDPQSLAQIEKVHAPRIRTGLGLGKGGDR